MKRIEAPTLAEALVRVEAECGKDALLIETKSTRRGYVVLATANERAPGPERTDRRSSIVSRLFTPKEWTKGFAAVAQTGLEFGLSRRVLTAIENAMLGTRIRLDSDNDPALPSTAARVLKALIPIETTPLDHRIIALVGPTGVGKTTTLAKLAAKASREEQESIAILSFDTYRIAAVEQIRAFSDMLHARFEVIFTPNDLRRALKQLADCDRIFIDTTGRGPFDSQSIASMAGALSDPSIHTALCIPAGLRYQDAKLVMEGFAPFDPRHLIITKWDETVAPGETLSLAIEREQPISYITVGQEVPDDIVDADAGVLAATALNLDQSIAENLL
jgi:flagellar biosynthesis GTPase FlhF